MENPKLNYVIISDSAFFTKGSDTLNIIGIFDKIFAQNFPAVHSRIAFVAVFNGPKGKYRHKFLFKKEDLKENLFEVDGEFEIPQDGAKAQLVLNINNLVFQGSGKYVAEVYIDNALQDLKAIVEVELAQK